MFLVGHDIEQRGSADLIFFLFGIQGLLIEVTGLNRRVQSDARLLQSNLRIVNINCGVIYDLLEIGLIGSLIEIGNDVISLRQAVADRNRQAELRVIFRVDAR